MIETNKLYKNKKMFKNQKLNWNKETDLLSEI